MAKLYASLTGPLLGLYFPLPDELADNKAQCYAAMNSSRLKMLWHSLYTPQEVQRQIVDHGGIMLGDDFAQQLDYDSRAVQLAGQHGKG